MERERDHQTHQAEDRALDGAEPRPGPLPFSGEPPAPDAESHFQSEEHPGEQDRREEDRVQRVAQAARSYFSSGASGPRASTRRA